MFDWIGYYRVDRPGEGARHPQLSQTEFGAIFTTTEEPLCSFHSTELDRDACSYPVSPSLSNVVKTLFKTYQYQAKVLMFPRPYQL
jgi:hypothetical protein